jgi:exosortase/archaeosortase family protein
LAVLFAALVTLIRPSLPGFLAGLIVTLVAGFVANVVRIAVLALGLAYSHRLGGIEVMEAPWHEAIGFICLAIGAAPLLLWAKAVVRGRSDKVCSVTDSVAEVEPCHPIPLQSRLPRLLGGMGFVFGTAVIISVPAHPVDVARSADPVALPASIAGLTGEMGALSRQERAYFTRYGGSAARAVYGSFALLVVSTSAPLRHLHGPDECLAGSGHRVRYVAARHGHLPTAVYRSVDPEGRRWRVAVTFVSDHGERAASVAEAVWRWLQRPATNWTMVQRIAPWGTPPSVLEAWDTAVARALDFPIPLTHSSQEILP